MGCRLRHALRLQFSVTCEDKPDLNLKKRYNFPWTEKANHFLGFRHVFLTKIFLNSAREGTLVSFGEGKLNKPTKKLFQSQTTISVLQSLYRDFSAKKIQKKQKHDQTNGDNNLLSITSLLRWAWRQSFVSRMSSAVNNHATMQIKQTAVKLFTNTCTWKNSTNHRGQQLKT